MRHFMPLLAAAALVLSPAAAQADLGDPLFKLLADDGAANDLFGVSVVIKGRTVIVGAYRDDDNGIDSGSAYLFDTTAGQQIAKLLPDDGAVWDGFGISIAISNTTAIVGAYRDDDNGPDSGSAYLFDTTTGLQIAKLLPNDGAPLDHFGVPVGISGTIAIVGAWGDDDNGFDSGSAYLFDTVTGQQIAKLLPDDGAANDYFGGSVAISGSTAIVGAWSDEDNGDFTGSAYLFDTTTGQQLAKLLADDGAEGAGFGFRVAIGGTTAIVGAWSDDANGTDSGSAYLFDTTTGLQIAKLLPNDGAPLDQFGVSVAISGATSIVGAWLDEDNGTNSGSAYLFNGAGCPEGSDGDGMVMICHIPPGNPDNAHTMRVGVNAVPVHLGHGDHCGPCQDDGGLLLGSGGDTGHDLRQVDFDHSGDVGPSDLAIMLGSWGPCGDPDDCPADLDGDGAVGPSDLALLLGSWGPC